MGVVVCPTCFYFGVNGDAFIANYLVHVVHEFLFFLPSCPIFIWELGGSKDDAVTPTMHLLRILLLSPFYGLRRLNSQGG